MNTPLQSGHLTTDEMTMPMLADVEDEHGAGEEAHIHLPNPSLWPLLLGIAVMVCLSGFLFINSNPWVTIIAAPFVLIGILGWGLQDPFAPTHGQKKGRVPSGFATSYTEAASTGKPTLLAEELLVNARDVADRTVTVSTTAWSAHPVNVEIESEGVVLALYGKVELEAQKEELEQTLLKTPGVIGVKNFLVAEDAILNQVIGSIDRLKAAGKLEGAEDITALVENYIVNLYGEVPNSNMKQMLEREIVGIPGVRVVVNHIGLNEDIPGNLGKTRNK